MFKLKENNTNVWTELVAGLTTFLAMAYILAVNPQILSVTGMDAGALFTATAVAAAIGTLCMAFFANYPIALASGMGLNAFFAFMATGGGFTWQIALTAILIEGVVFILLTLFKFREAIVNAIPKDLKLAITAGIGLFIAFIGFKNSGLFTVLIEPGSQPLFGTTYASGSTTLLDGNFTSAVCVLAFIGIVLGGILMWKKVKGAILIAILATWILGMGAQLIGWYVPNFDAGLYPLIPQKIVSMPPDISPIFFKFDFVGAWKAGINFVVLCFAFLMVDMFDTIGTLVGVANQAKLVDKDGKLPRIKGALMADAVGTTAGSILGVSTVTSYIESSAGVAVGGRTGLASIFTGAFFLLALFLSPLFLTIPAFATAPALILVGVMMMRSVKDIEWTDMSIAVPAFLTIAFMPFTSSIANGILIGFLAWTLIKVLGGKGKEVSVMVWIVDALFILKLIIPILQSL